MKEPWEHLLLTHAESVFKYLLKIGVKKEDAEDIVQETIIKTIECLPQLDGKYLRAWLFKVAIHRYYTLYKQQKRLAFFRDEELTTIQDALNIEEALLQHEQHANLREALQRLQPNFQQLLLMKYFMNLSYKEIANILDVTESHVKTYLQRARRSLRTKWEEFDE